jgi:FecR protein
MDGAAMKQILLGIFVLSTLTGVVRADDYDDPTRGVARISMQQGDVSVRRGDSGEVTAAATNAPLMSQDAMRTGPSARAEIQFDYANYLRLAANSEVHFADIEQARFQAQVASGTVTLTVMAKSGAQVEVDTPNVGVRPGGPGAFRVTVREDGTSEITVRSGQAEVFTQQGSETLGEGRTMLVRGPASDPEFQTTAAIGFDEWDQWNQQCDQRIEHAQSAERKYVNPEVYGTESMDGYGTWTEDPDYGYVWQPTVAPGWAPYRYGRWVWEDWYGWTWVSYDPWGWAPYHWGRWYMGRSGWCWYPGGHGYWRPALVGFFGFGARAGVGVGFGFANIGWVPLGPHEAFYPWWGRGFYGGRGGITVVNNINVVSAFRNARVMNGVTAVGAGQFGRGGINGNSMRVTAGDLRSAGLVRGQVPLTPGRESLRMSDRAAGATGFNTGRQFYSHMQATNVNRVPFAQQQRGLQQTTHSYGRPVGGGAASQGSAGTGASGWRRVGDAPPAATSRTAAPSPENWHRFDSPSNRASSGSASSGGGYYGGGQPVRISPQIVHERQSTGGGYGNGGYGGGSSAPAYHPGGAPAHSSGGGGGGRSSGGGGGGGGGHSSGGGGGGGGGHSGGGGGGHR